MSPHIHATHSVPYCPIHIFKYLTNAVRTSNTQKKTVSFIPSFCRFTQIKRRTNKWNGIGMAFEVKKSKRYVEKTNEILWMTYYSFLIIIKSKRNETKPNDCLPYLFFVRLFICSHNLSCLQLEYTRIAHSFFFFFG